MEKLSNIIKLNISFKDIIDLQQTCKLQITDIEGENWNFYFRNGSLLWAMASKHRARRIYRVVNKYYPNIDCSEVQLREQEISELWGYLLISILEKRGEISTPKATQIIQEIAAEHLFDCFQHNTQIKEIKSIFETSANTMGAILRSSLFKQPIVYMDIGQLTAQGESAYQSWVKVGLSKYSPNLAPTIKDGQTLEQTVGADTYNRLSILIDGKRTLRDIAIATKQELITLTCSLMPYVKNGSLELQTISDLPIGKINFSTKQHSANKKRSHSDSNRNHVRESELPLIVCIDDNPRICQNMAQILNPAGYRMIAVNESIQALPVLLENKPDLIFLDLIMPVANGYEICGQIRKMSNFKTIPIIILTGNDGIIDRVRAKMVGATDFLCKPIDRQAILATAHKYTQGLAIS